MFTKEEVKQKIEKIISNLDGLKEPKSQTTMFKVFADFVADYTILQLKSFLKEVDECSPKKRKN